MAWREDASITKLTVEDLIVNSSIIAPMADEMHFGKKFFVLDSTGVDGPGRGGFNSPFASVDYALGKARNNKDDAIYMLPGHAETLTGAGGLTIDKQGVSLIGLGRYDARPTFLMDGAATVSCLVTAANSSLKNCRFNPGHADINYAFLVTAKGFRLDSCKFDEITTDENWVDIIHVSSADNDADGLELINNEINLTDAAHVTAIDLLKNIDDAKIIGNRITGDFDATPYAPIYMAVGEVPKNILIAGNLIHNLHDDNAVVAISIACTTATGWMINNHAYGLDVAGETPFLTGATGLYCSGNMYTYAGTASGFEYPAIGALS
jgi:hypothetical protein